MAVIILGIGGGAFNVATILETDRERDLRARDEWLKEYDKYGDAGTYVRMVEEHVLDVKWDEYSTSRAQMEPRLTRWGHYVDRYNGEYMDSDDDSPFFNINPPKIARMVDIHTARTLQTVIPDRSRMDFFGFEPETDYEGVAPDPEVQQYADAAVNAVRNDLINSKYISELKKGLFDLFALGNCVFMASWDLDIQYRYRRIPNPDFDPAMPFTVNEVDGETVITPVSPEIDIREPYREFDAPRIRHINVRNVFPSELDKDSLEECASVSIYDTVRLSDMLENEIGSGGYLYANLSRLQFDNEETDIPEIADQDHRGEWEHEAFTHVRSAKKFDRVSCIGRFRLTEIFNDIGVPENMRKRVIKILAKKYNWDVSKLTGWNTWVIEMVSRGSVLARFQPSPYAVDKKPIVSMGLFRVPNQTWAQGIYDRCVNSEIVGNAMERYRMELTLQMVRPQMFVDRGAIDNQWRMIHGDNYSFSPRQVIYLKNGKRANEAIQFPSYPTAPLQYADLAQSQMQLDMSEMGHLPPVKMGSASGGATASEVQNMGSSADIMLQEICLDVQDKILGPSIGWILRLHHQYTMEPRMGYELDPQGKAIMSMIPPDVWLHQYRINLLGFQQVGNLAVRTMNFNEYAKFLQGAGRANLDELAVAYAKLLGIPNGGAMIAPPPEPPPPMQDTTHTSLTLRPELLPPAVIGKMLEQMGIEVTPDDLAQLGAIKEAQERAAIYESTLENNEAKSKLQQSMMGARSSAGGQGGSPAGVPEAQPSSYMPGSHHRMGEQENRQRGVHDEQGLVGRMSQKFRNPMNSRRANA